MNRIQKLFKALFSREVIFYVIAGVLATLVNVGVFTVLNALFGDDKWWISQAPAVAAAMLFAFFSNRIFVFKSHGPIMTELVKFLSSRLLVSLAFEYGAYFLLFNILGLVSGLPFLHWHIPYAKILTQVLVMVGNYVFSKWFIFVGRKDPDQDKEPSDGLS